MRVATKGTKKSVEQSTFSIIRDIPPQIYHNLIKKHYKTFNGGYKLENFNELIPELDELIEYLKSDIKAPLPKDAKLSIQMGIYSRNSSTYMEAPMKTSALRILINLGHCETYYMNPEYKYKGNLVNSGLDEKYLHLTANQYCILGPLNMSEYLIQVSSDPKIIIPAKNVLESERATLRLKNYKRITIVIDYNVDVDVIDKLKNVAAESIAKIKVKGTSNQNEINKQIEEYQKSMLNNKELNDKVKELIPEKKEKTELEKLAESIPEKDKDELERMMNDIV